MKRAISTIVAVGFVSSMLVSTAYAGNRHLEILNPLWVPAAILSTLAAVTISFPQPVVYEQKGYPEARQTVIYEQPRYYRYDRRPDYAYEESRHYRQVRSYNRERDYHRPYYREYR